VILIDTGPIVAAASKRDQHHASYLTALRLAQRATVITSRRRWLDRWLGELF
jgi:predicted nucleic acid-binding protein